jgi:hypothetical protein
MIKNSRTVPERNRPRATVRRRGGLPCAVGRKGAGPRPGSLVRPWSGPRAHAVMTARWRRGHRAARARDSTVASSPTARRWLAGGKVLPVTSWGPPGGRQAMRAEAGLTQTTARRWGSRVTRRGCVRRRWSWHGGYRRASQVLHHREREEGEVGIKEGGRGAG